ncbi:MAG: hypothetical protein JOZ83_02550 [Silvibacterium sp.]|nr:hypothetical protein [Silvibacterium sp.]
MAFTLMLKQQDHGGFLLTGPQTSADLGSGAVMLVSTDDSAVLSVHHPPPPGPDKQINFRKADTLTVFANGDLLIHSTEDPSPLRCTEADWPKDWTEPAKGYQAYHLRK